MEERSCRDDAEFIISLLERDFSIDFKEYRQEAVAIVNATLLVRQACGQNPAPQTARQLEVLRFATEFKARHGYEASYGQVARRLGVSSRATVAKHFRALERQGLWVTHSTRKKKHLESFDSQQGIQKG